MGMASRLEVQAIGLGTASRSLRKLWAGNVGTLACPRVGRQANEGRHPVESFPEEQRLAGSETGQDFAYGHRALPRVQYDPRRSRQ